MKTTLINAVQSTIPELTESDILLIIDNLCAIQNPRFNPINTDIEYLKIDPVKKIGVSIKPGNIFVNIKKLIIDSAEISLTIAGVVAQPYLIPLAALVIWNKVYSNVKIDLNESQAMTIKLMWENRIVERNWMEEDKAHKLYNSYLISKNKNEVLEEDFKLILADLEKIGCIVRNSENIWWLREWVKNSI